MKVVTGSDRRKSDIAVASFPAGGVIFNDGDLGTEMFIIQKGKVEIRKQIGAEARVLSVLEKGDFFGEMSILEGMPRTATAVAVEETECIPINEATFDQMLRQNEEIAIRMLRRFSKKLRETTELLNRMAGREGKIPSLEETQHRQPVVPDAAVFCVLISVEIPDKVFHVRRDGPTLIGRRDAVTEIYPDVDLSPVDTNRSVSRRHAKITVTDRELFLHEEIGTTNGTFLNGERLKKGEFYPLHYGDEVQFGLVRCTFEQRGK